MMLSGKIENILITQSTVDKFIASKMENSGCGSHYSPLLQISTNEMSIKIKRLNQGY